MEVVTQPRYWGEPRNISVRISKVPAKTRTQHFPIKSHERYRYNNPLGHTFPILNELFNDAVNCYENTASVLHDWVWINGRMIPTEEIQSTSRKTCPENPTRTRMEVNPGLQNEKPVSPVSKNSPTFLLQGVGYRVKPLSSQRLFSTRLHPPQGKYWSCRRSDTFMWNIKPSQLRSVHKKTW
jgi:hypothetical protein